MRGSKIFALRANYDLAPDDEVKVGVHISIHRPFGTTICLYARDRWNKEPGWFTGEARTQDRAFLATYIVPGIDELLARQARLAAETVARSDANACIRGLLSLEVWAHFDPDLGGSRLVEAGGSLFAISLYGSSCEWLRWGPAMRAMIEPPLEDSRLCNFLDDPASFDDLRQDAIDEMFVRAQVAEAERARDRQESCEPELMELDTLFASPSKVGL